MAPLLSIDEIRSAGRSLAAPFRLRVVDAGKVEEIRCEQIFRMLPARRIVCSLQWRSQPAIAKIFLNRRTPANKARRDIDGLAAIRRAGIPAPQLFADCTSEDGLQPILIFERIEPAEAFGDRMARCPDEGTRLRLLEKAVELIARQHEAGSRQLDPHFGNILARGDDLYAIDGGTVRVDAAGRPIEIATGLASLGRFLAESRPADDQFLPQLCSLYARIRRQDATDRLLNRLTRSVRVSRNRRLGIILSKTTRECTEFTQYTENGFHVICHRDCDSPEMRRILTAPEDAIAAGTILKDGNSTTTAHIQVAGRSIVIKRFNPSSIREMPLDLGPAIRGRRAWKNVHLLDALEVPVAKPIAYVERTFGPLKTIAYVLAEFVSGERGQVLFRRTDLSHQQVEDIASSTAELINGLHHGGVSHGDLKATNISYRGSNPVLFDVDAVRQHRFGFLARRRQLRDCRQLLQTFDESSPLYRNLAERIAAGPASKPDVPGKLPQQRVRRGALSVWFTHDCPVPMSKDLLNCLDRSDAPRVPEESLLKISRRRSIFRINSGDFPLVVKAFPFEHLVKKLRWKDYALAEFCNNSLARNLGTRAPEYYAFFQIRRRGLVENCGVLMKDLRDHTDLERLAQDDASQFIRAVPVLAELYATGVHHLDVKPSNVFFHNHTGVPVIIDWQYCRFHAPRNNVQLVMQAAHFLNFAALSPGSELWASWIAELHRQSGTEMNLQTLEIEIRNMHEQKLRVCDFRKAPERRFRAA